MNVIPAIDLHEGQCVRLYQGDFAQQTNYAKEPASLASEYQTMGFDTLHIVDLDGARYGKQRNQEIIRKIVETSELTTVQLGGGIRTEAQIESWLDSGLARVVIGSLAISEPDRVRDWLANYGPEKIVLALDVNVTASGVPHLATHGWRQTEEITLWQCIAEYETEGLRHVLCTDISRDGALSGPNLDLYAELINRYPDIKMQASGGVRNIDDLHALRVVGAAAAISGRALLDGIITGQEIATFLPGA
jgi:phosphoribosylformimino-5-aminoimidazole carboxamide ribotide isomerase